MASPVLSGSLSAFRLPDVLTFLSTTRKSGTLTLVSTPREAALFFADGALVYAGSNQEQFRLGSVLVRRRRISQEDRDRIDALMRNGGGQFGVVALQSGILNEAQLRDCLKLQVSEILFDAFVWERGSFELTSNIELPPYAVTIAVDLPNLIMEGARRIDEWEKCVALLPNRAAVYRVVVIPRADKITLTAEEWKILFLVNGVRTLDDLCRDSDEDALQVYRVVYGLLANQLIEEAAPKPGEDETANRATERAIPVPEDATMRQRGEPRFSAESTVRETPDDTSLLVSSNAHLSYSDVVRPTIARITIRSGENNGRVVPLSDPEYGIGRHTDNSVLLADPGVSAFHARIYRGAEGYILEDLKSRNGTWINGTRIFHATLSNGDVIHVGQSDLLYEVLY